MSTKFLLLLTYFSFSLSCTSWGKFWETPANVYNNTGTANWARTVSSGANISAYTAVATDNNGNVVAAGAQDNNGAYSFGAASATGGNPAGNNGVVVKYNSLGTALWARAGNGSASSIFNATATDSQGNIYAAGYQSGNAPYDYAGVAVSGSHSGNNAVIVKFDSSGNALWAKSTTSGAGASQFSALAVDASGNIYAGGGQSGTLTYTYGGQSVSGSSTLNSWVLVKFDTNGNGLWARSVAGCTPSTQVVGLATDSANSVYAAGLQVNNSACSYGSQSVTGFHTVNNSLIVKYDSDGTAQWARSVSSGGANSDFRGVAADTLGNIFVVGQQETTAAFTYGSQVVSGTHSVNNAIVVKYDRNGSALWARSVSSGNGNSSFAAVATNGQGTAYAGGFQTGTGQYSFGDQAIAGTHSVLNITLVKYDVSGNAIWARTVGAGLGNSRFAGVAVDTSGYLYAGGIQFGNGAFQYGTQSATGAYSSGNNVSLVRYD